MNGAAPAALVGQEAAERVLSRAWQSGRLHHAWLLSGPAGIGKATLARGFARTVLGSGEGAMRRVASGTHADLLVISRQVEEKRQVLRREIVLEDVRPVGAFLHRTAAEGGWRVVIVDGADHLNRNAANALLKLIEEPPACALLLLVSDAPGRLPATIRSRCRSLRLPPLDDDAMRTVLRRLLPELDEATRDGLVALGRGSPGHALSLAADGGLALSALVRDVLSRPGRLAGAGAYDLADAVLRHESGSSVFLGLLSAAISTSIRSEIRVPGAASDLLAALPAQRWAEICAGLASLRDETERLNLDKRQAVLAALTLLGE